MYAFIVLLLGFAGSASALSLQPSFLDDLAGYDSFVAEFKIVNEEASYKTFVVTARDISSNKQVYKNVVPVAGRSSMPVKVSLFDLPADEIKVYEVCAHEQTEDPVALRVCSRLRVYWPLAILGRQ